MPWRVDQGDLTPCYQFFLPPLDRYKNKLRTRMHSSRMQWPPLDVSTRECMISLPVWYHVPSTGGSRQEVTSYSPLWIEWWTLLKTLPSLAVGNFGTINLFLRWVCASIHFQVLHLLGQEVGQNIFVCITIIVTDGYFPWKESVEIINWSIQNIWHDSLYLIAVNSFVLCLPVFFN